jgi:cation diffusion facilitator family transporter
MTEAPHNHDHDHEGHEHGTSPWAKARHVLSGVTGSHSHDAADQIDDALEADADGRRALLISLVGLALTAALQIVVVVISGSVALLGDAVHNVADALTAVPLFVAFTLAKRPPSKRYTYGYGRSEDLAGVFIILTITASAGFAAYEAIQRLLHPQDVHYLVAVGAAGLVGFVGNEAVARYRIRVGRRIGSAALVADGLHARTDGFTSLAVVVGAIGVGLGFRLADPIVGLLITVAILGVLRSAVREVVARLLDAVDPELVDQASASLQTVEGVRAVRELRLRWIGHTIRAEADIAIDPELSQVEAHLLAHHAEQHLLRDVRRLTAATVHTSPDGNHEIPEHPAASAPGTHEHPAASAPSAPGAHEH